MKKIETNVSFADSDYKSCETKNNDLIININSWDGKNIRVIFSNAIQFIYRGGSFIQGIYKGFSDDSFLKEALNQYYEKVPLDHPFKVFEIIDIDDQVFFKIIAEEIHISKE